MKQSLAYFCLLIFLVSVVRATITKDNFCERTVTERQLVPVTKQRTIIKAPPKWAVWRKSKSQTEDYQTTEEIITHKIVKECCEGYRLDEGSLCEPVCSRGCPSFASCVAPQQCQCITGYVSAIGHSNGTTPHHRYCEPVCERPCQKGAHCVAPQTCACLDGHRAMKPTGDGVSAPCEPICNNGLGCGHLGTCLKPNHCVCPLGYVYEPTEQKCKEEMVSHAPLEVTEYLEDLLEPSSTPSVAKDCSPGFVLYSDECRPEVFSSNEQEEPIRDCRTENASCGAHQKCDQELGICTCAPGYNKDNTTDLLCSRGLLEELLSVDEATDENGELNPLTIPILGVASGILFVLVIVVGATRTLRKHGQEIGINAQPTNALQCEYSQKSYDVDEWVP